MLNIWGSFCKLSEIRQEKWIPKCEIWCDCDVFPPWYNQEKTRFNKPIVYTQTYQYCSYFVSYWYCVLFMHIYNDVTNLCCRGFASVLLVELHLQTGYQKDTFRDGDWHSGMVTDIKGWWLTLRDGWQVLIKEVNEMK